MKFDIDMGVNHSLSVAAWHARPVSTGLLASASAGRRRSHRALIAWPFVRPLLDGRNVDPAALFPALESLFRQLHTLGSFKQIPPERLVRDDMPEEHLPLCFECVIEGLLLGNLL